MNWIAFALLATLPLFTREDHGHLKKRVKNDFAPVGGNLYVAKYETTNAEYREFLVWARMHESEPSATYQLDTAAWERATPKWSPFGIYYHRHAAYDDYPVVTVPHHAALAYCRYMTAVYNGLTDRQHQKVVFRLPTEQEWIHASTAGKPNRIYAWDGHQLRNGNGTYRANCSLVFESDIRYNDSLDRHEIVNSPSKLRPSNGLADRRSFWPNEFGLFNTIGNAAEMIAEPGIAKGGSFCEPGYNLQVSQRRRYDRPSPEIGFRVVMEVINP